MGKLTVYPSNNMSVRLDIEQLQYTELNLEAISEDVYIQRAEGSAQSERKWLQS